MHFSLHTAFPMYNIENSLSSQIPKEDAKKVEYSVDQPLFYYSYCMNI